MVRTCSDWVPGTEKVFERIAESFELAKPPARKTTAQNATTDLRCRKTSLVPRVTRTSLARDACTSFPVDGAARQADPRITPRRDRGAVRRAVAGAAV